MADSIEFPNNPMEFIKAHSFKDSDEVYTNGSELVPVYIVEQMLEHYLPNHNKGKQTNADRIRGMSDEELAESRIDKIDIYGCHDSEMWIGDFAGYVESKEEAVKLELEWLQSEVEG